jgi:hypothetical protein
MTTIGTPLHVSILLPEKGRAWVAAICATPPPVQCWKDANGKVIDV